MTRQPLTRLDTIACRIRYAHDWLDRTTPRESPFAIERNPLRLFTRTYRLRWTGSSHPLREVAERIHEEIRSGVLVKVERGEPVLFVSCGVVIPPGPTRLQLEDRRRGLP